MKKLFYCAAILFAFVACSESEPADNGSNNGGGNTPTTPTITLNKSSVSFDEFADEESISFSATADWIAEIVNDRADGWLSVTPQSGIAGDASITIKAKDNDTPDERNASVRIKAGTTSKTISVSQKQKDALTITSSKYEVGAEGGEVKIEVKANIDFEYAIDESAKEWIKYEGTRAMKTSTLTFSVAENDDIEKREGEIVIKSGDLSETVKIYQVAAAPVINATESYEVDYKESILEVVYESNFDCVVTIPEDCNWISMYEDTRAIESHSVKLAISQNTSINSRTANIVISNNENTISKTIKITQKCAPHLDVNLSEAGMLSKYIDEDTKLNIASLKIKGKLNGDDIRIIREMAGVNHLGEETSGNLSILDLSEAHIVEGGSAYYFPSNTYFKTAYTNNSTIGRYMFAKCKSLTKLILPIECLEIEDYGIEYCVNLTEITLSDNIKRIGTSAFADCEKITEFYLPNSINQIDSNAFARCYSLKSITLPNSITKLSRAILWSCTSLENVIIPESVTTVEGVVFAYCSSLKEIVFPDSVEKITDSGVFQDCTALSKIVLGVNFKEARSGTFNYLAGDNIKEIHCKATTPPICSFAEHFYEATLYIPKDSYEAYTSSQYWVKFKKIETIY